ncbi:MAG: carbon storage regulator [Gammaproteobacteria bacterium]
MKIELIAPPARSGAMGLLSRHSVTACARKVPQRPFRYLPAVAPKTFIPPAAGALLFATSGVAQDPSHQVRSSSKHVGASRYQHIGDATGVSPQAAARGHLSARGNSMLILTRRPTQRVYIGEEIRITVLGVTGNVVRLGIDAPAHISIDREEVRERKLLELATAEEPDPEEPRPSNSQQKQP